MVNSSQIAQHMGRSVLDLDERVCEPEVMDQPGLDPAAHRHALQGLHRVNRLSGTASRLWRTIVTRFRLRYATQPIRLLDLACGGGDVAIELARCAQRDRIPVDIHGWDISETAIATATESARDSGLPSVHFHTRHALDETLEERGYDVVYCTLFLHHLERPQGLALMRRMQFASRGLVIIDDLRRTRMGFALAWLGCHLLTRSPIVHIDGPRSVRAAFREEEVIAMAAEAGLQPITIERHWPQRFLLTWQRPT